jgi:N utilization substance protein B
MKTSLDPRHKTRQEIVQDLFANSFLTQELTNKKTQAIIESEPKLDDWIKKIAPEFPIEKINKVDLSILRLAVYEMTIEKDAPPKVVIDEAIELAKEFGGDTSPAFINGALGKLLKEMEGTKIVV